MPQKLAFYCDYMEGAHPAIIERIMKTNLEKLPGYGLDSYTESAKEKIRQACGCPEAEIYFLVGGTQANATCIDALLRSYQGVVAAQTGHISVHEAGAIEFGGHKVLELPSADGKLQAAQIEECLEAFHTDENRDHMVMPGMVYISQPTEYGTLYSKAELTALSQVCHRYGIPLYVDGARLAYALACLANDVTLRDLAQLSDIFYIGGTKCGALLGEAVVLPKAGLIPHFFTIIKQHGALLAKGRVTGIQFDTLFTDGLYERIGVDAIRYADMIRQALKEYGYKLYCVNPTNQVFCQVDDKQLAAIGKDVEYGFWEKTQDGHTIIRFATDWATTEKDVQELIGILKKNMRLN